MNNQKNLNMSTLMSLQFLTLASSGTDSTGQRATQTAVLQAKCVNEPACLDSVIVLLINEPHGLKLTWCHFYEQQSPLD